MVLAKRSRWLTEPRGTPKPAELGLMVRRREASLLDWRRGRGPPLPSCARSREPAARSFWRAHSPPLAARSRYSNCRAARPSVDGSVGPGAVVVGHPSPGIAGHEHVAGAGIEGKTAVLERAPIGADEVGLPDVAEAGHGHEVAVIVQVAHAVGVRRGDAGAARGRGVAIVILGLVAIPGIGGIIVVILGEHEGIAAGGLGGGVVCRIMVAASSFAKARVALCFSASSNCPEGPVALSLPLNTATVALLALPSSTRKCAASETVTDSRAKFN